MVVVVVESRENTNPQIVCVEYAPIIEVIEYYEVFFRIYEALATLFEYIVRLLNWPL